MRRIVGLAFVSVFMMTALFAFSDSVVFPDALSTMSFGFLLLAAYLFGDILSQFRLPRITGYILAGIVLGPYVLKFVSADTVRDLKLIDDLALTFIALAAGGELRLKELRERLKSIILTVLSLTVIVFIGVTAFVMVSRPLMPFLDGKPAVHLMAVASVLGVLAVARSPSSAIAIISECKSRGPFTEMVLGVTVVMDVLVIIIFAALVSICQMLIVPGSRLDLGFILVITIELTGSILAGIILGRFISHYIKYVKVELPVFILGLAFMVTFFSRQFAVFLDWVYGISFHLEPMLICMTSGFWVQNFSKDGELFIETIDRSSLPVYVLFFSLTGAALNLDALIQTWLFAILMVTVRIIFIWLGAYLGARLSGDPPRFCRMSGLSFITQAGVSLGLCGIVIRRFTEWGAALATIIVAVILLNQIIGPITFKFALNAVGESRDIRKKSLVK